MRGVRAAVVVLLLAAACGGGGDDETAGEATTTTTSKPTRRSSTTTSTTSTTTTTAVAPEVAAETATTVGPEGPVHDDEPTAPDGPPPAPPGPVAFIAPTSAEVTYVGPCQATPADIGGMHYVFTYHVHVRGGSGWTVTSRVTMHGENDQSGSSAHTGYDPRPSADITASGIHVTAASAGDVHLVPTAPVTVHCAA